MSSPVDSAGENRKDSIFGGLKVDEGEEKVVLSAYDKLLETNSKAIRALELELCNEDIEMEQKLANIDKIAALMKQKEKISTLMEARRVELQTVKSNANATSSSSSSSSRSRSRDVHLTKLPKHLPQFVGKADQEENFVVFKTTMQAAGYQESDYLRALVLCSAGDPALMEWFSGLTKLESQPSFAEIRRLYRARYDPNAGQWDSKLTAIVATATQVYTPKVQYEYVRGYHELLLKCHEEMSIKNPTAFLAQRFVHGTIKRIGGHLSCMPAVKDAINSNKADVMDMVLREAEVLEQQLIRTQEIKFKRVYTRSVSMGVVQSEIERLGQEEDRVAAVPAAGSLVAAAPAAKSSVEDAQVTNDAGSVMQTSDVLDEDDSDEFDDYAREIESDTRQAGSVTIVPWSDGSDS
jgi:hypothetical protein